MNETEHIVEATNTEDKETWFLAQLEQDTLDIEKLKPTLQEVKASGDADGAESLAQLMEEALAERGDYLAAIDVLALRTAWHTSDASFKKTCRKAATAMLKNDRDRRALIEHAGFDKPITAGEGLRRLRVLLGLSKGVLCHDKTWGFGVVNKVDGFYKRVEIDFDKKRDHHMSLAYAAESLDLIDDDHILAIKHRDAARVDELIKKDPAEVVRMVLRNYGPMPVAQLQETMVPQLIPEASWKKFWDAARKVLKKDPLAHVPTKRSEPLELLAEEKAYNEAWFDNLATERRMETILEKLDHLSTETDLSELSDAFRRIAGERLAFVIRGAGQRQVNLTARAIILASTLRIPRDIIDVEQHVSNLLDPKRLLKIAAQLSARDFKQVLAYLLEHDEERTVRVLQDVLLTLPVGALTEVIENLRARGHEETSAAMLRDAVARDEASVAVACWLSRNLDLVERWNLGAWSQIMQLMLREMEADYAGEEGRAQKQLGDRFKSREWLKTILHKLDDKGRRAAIQGVKESSGWLLLDQRSIMGQMVKICPELERELATDARRQAGGAVTDRVTSFRSYEARKKQMADIISVELPRIAKEIGKAREYGDLRENFEFKAAKDMQRLLVQRRDALENMLHEVTPTDFNGFPNDVAGVGTSVLIKYEDGKEERYYILGEWDTDEGKGIISSQTRMAGSLAGSRPGETVTVPTEEGERACVVEEVAALPDHIREWIQGDEQRA